MTVEMARPRRKTKPPAARDTTQEVGAITIRMYDVGFGDCFLVSIPTPDGPRRILFDCGSIKSGERPVGEVVNQLLRDVTDDQGRPRIDVVVATHRHKDHVSGFDHPAWRQVDVGEVWMPWTEDPDDAEAKRIREVQSRLAATLMASSETRLGMLPQASAERLRLELMRDLALNALSNAEAMRTLHHGFLGAPLRRFLPQDGTSKTWFETKALPGVAVHVLGPSRDLDVIRDMDPPAGQSYLKLAEVTERGQKGPPDPFGPDWFVESGKYAIEYGSLAAALPLDDRMGIQNVGAGFDELVAATLDKAVNGTSLMLVLQVGRATLLFPGDAQWGTWRRAMESPDFRQLLSETNFYKIGHHGSHNATPVEFVKDLLGKNFWAMASVTGMAQWPRIPKQELMKELKEKEGAKIARSDEPDEAGVNFKTGDGFIDARVPV